MRREKISHIRFSCCLSGHICLLSPRLSSTSSFLSHSCFLHGFTNYNAFILLISSSSDLSISPFTTFTVRPNYRNNLQHPIRKRTSRLHCRNSEALSRMGGGVNKAFLHALHLTFLSTSSNILGCRSELRVPSEQSTRILVLERAYMLQCLFNS